MARYGDPDYKPPEVDGEGVDPEPWSGEKQDLAAVLWPSFLAAGVATMLFFAFFDPVELYPAMAIPFELSRMQGYGLGFFFFWLITAASSAMSVFLARTAHRRGNGG